MLNRLMICTKKEFILTLDHSKAEKAILFYSLKMVIPLETLADEKAKRAVADPGTLKLSN